MATTQTSTWITITAAWPVLFAVGCVQNMGPQSDLKTPVEIASTPAFADIAEPADVAEDTNSETLSSTISKVTVYSDRALVTRQAQAEISTEPKVFAFKTLPGWVDDGSVRVSVSAGRIIDVQTRRRFLARATDENYLKAEEEHQDLLSQQAILDDEIKILEAQHKQIETIRAFSMEKVTKDTTVGNIGVETYGKVIAFVSDALRSTAKERRAVQIRRKKLAPDLKASQRNLDEFKNLTQLEETTVLVTLQSSQASTSTIELTYMLPGATWEPMHELRASSDALDTVELTSFAVVTQTSGEDWAGAKLYFSTQSSTQTVHIPELEALTLGDTQTATRILKSQFSSFSRAQKAFESQNMFWNKRNQKSAQHNFEQMYQSNYEYLQVAQSKTVQLFKSLQKRGTTVHFQAKTSTNVRGDGRSVRLRIGQSQLKANQKIVAAPEQSLNAARTLEMTNSSSQPFLPGKVTLYQDGAFLGLTNLGFIAEGEKFALFAGVADHLKLSRKMDRKQSSLVRKKRTRMKVAFIVTVENLSDRPTSLTLADRIPVSENKEIKIERIAISPTLKPTSEGILNWSLTLQPREKRQFDIAYEIEYPPTLILETKRKEKFKPRSPARPSPVQRKKYDLNEQIMHMEKNF